MKVFEFVLLSPYQIIMLKEIIAISFGEVLDKVYESEDLSKKSNVNESIHDFISRIDITKDVFIMAMTKFVNSHVLKDVERNNYKIKE